MNETTTKALSSASNPSKAAEPAAWLAILATGAAILLLAALHVLSPEFSPSWRVISEYAFGHYGSVLSLMFLSSGIGTWALAVAIWPQVHTTGGRVGLWFLIISGTGSAMASVFDVTHEIGHGIAGLLGGHRLPHCRLVAERGSGPAGNLEADAKKPALDRKPKLDQRRSARGDTGHHDDANGAAQWRPFASTRAEGVATGSTCAGWLGRPPDCVVGLGVGPRCGLACNSGAPLRGDDSLGKL